MPLFPAPRPATHESASLTVRRLQIFVLFTGPEQTANALRAAAAFASDLGGEILIAAPLVVPYPLPLDCPPIDQQTLLTQIMHSVAQSGISCAIQKVLIAHARDRHDACHALLPHGCIVVLGQARSPIQRFRTWLSARFLRTLGHEVIVA